MLIFYSNEVTPRIEYIVDLIFRQILKIEVHITSNSAEFRKSNLPKFNYSFEKFDDELYLKPHRIVHCKAHITPTIKPVWYKGEKYFCESSKDSVLPFDPLAASFYLVTRHEEYIETNFDKLKRYHPDNSILSKYKLLKKPVVNIWAEMLAEILKNKYPDFTFPERKFEFLSTIDVDNAWAYLNKGFWRTTAALVKSYFIQGKTGFKERKDVLFGSGKDPYDSYDYLDTVFAGNEEKVKFFFLVGDYGRYDKNISAKNKKYQRLMNRIKNKYDVGIHPSFSSSKKGGKKKVQMEKSRLEKIVGTEITSSRQHYLRLRFPRTYNRLLKAGITSDYTMGYAAQPGFRAGICTPYYWYDLKNEITTNLQIVPFQVMDATFRHYLRVSPAEAIQEIEDIMLEVKKVKGTFVSIWHNETVNDKGIWTGYREVFEKMNKLGFEWANE